jgi:hypothetical protein
MKNQKKTGGKGEGFNLVRQQQQQQAGGSPPSCLPWIALCRPRSLPVEHPTRSSFAWTVTSCCWCHQKHRLIHISLSRRRVSFSFFLTVVIELPFAGAIYHPRRIFFQFLLPTNSPHLNASPEPTCTASHGLDPPHTVIFFAHGQSATVHHLSMAGHLRCLFASTDRSIVFVVSCLTFICYQFDLYRPCSLVRRHHRGHHDRRRSCSANLGARW